VDEEKKIRKFLIILFLIISNNAIATVEGETLICNEDRRGYNFITKDKVEVLDIDLNELNITSIDQSYQLAENVIFIQKPIQKFNNYEKLKPVGWIFRRTLDYVSLDYVNGDWSRKFLWSCEITSSDQLKKRLKEKINILLKDGEKK